MSAPNDEPSLIQQRIALQRRRSFAVYTLVFMAFMLVGWTVILFLDGDLWRWIGVALFTAGVAGGIFEYRRAMTAIRTFEETHGAGAGLQP